MLDVPPYLSFRASCLLVPKCAFARAPFWMHSMSTACPTHPGTCTMRFVPDRTRTADEATPNSAALADLHAGCQSLDARCWQQPAGPCRSSSRWICKRRALLSQRARARQPKCAVPLIRSAARATAQGLSPVFGEICRKPRSNPGRLTNAVRALPPDGMKPPGCGVLDSITTQGKRGESCPEVGALTAQLLGCRLYLHTAWMPALSPQRPELSSCHSSSGYIAYRTSA